MLSRNMNRVLAIGALSACIVLLALALLRSEPQPTFSVVIPAADNIVPGQAIKAGGRDVGAVTDVATVDHGRAAKVTMRVADDAFWPLPRDSKMEIRFGGTASFSNQYLLLSRGTSRALIADGGVLPAKQVKVPVQVDTLLSAFTPAVRRGFRRLLTNGARTIERSDEDLHRALGRTAPATEGASDLFQDLTANQEALRTIVRSSGSVVDAVDRSSPDLRVLLTGAAQTFDAIASRSADVETSLTRLPAALRQTRSTLREADVTLRSVGDLTDRLAPGVGELQRIASPLSALMTRLRTVTPAARSALQQVPFGAGGASRITGSLASLAPRIGAVAAQAATELDCVRPYAPELASMMTNWADFMSPVDDRDHLLRATIQAYPPTTFNSSALTPADAVKLFPGLRYGFPRPPGEIADQPWFQPQCGAGPDALDPAKDQEAKTFDENKLPPGSKLATKKAQP